MSNSLTVLSNKLAQRFGMDGEGVLATLKATAFKGQVSDAQMASLMIVADQYGLNPWTREIYAFPDKNNGIVPVVGVDGWARIINENPQFDGMEFDMAEDGSECTCTIYRKDRSHPTKVTEYFSECRRENAQPWRTHPKRMLRHKSMIQSARLAFGFVGIFDQDEAERIVEKEVAGEVIRDHAVRDVLSDADFEAQKQKWKASVSEGRKTADALIAWVESKGVDMTFAQKNEVETWAKKQETIEGELSDDPFVKDMKQAEGEEA